MQLLRFIDPVLALPGDHKESEQFATLRSPPFRQSFWSRQIGLAEAPDEKQDSVTHQDQGVNRGWSQSKMTIATSTPPVEEPDAPTELQDLR